MSRNKTFRRELMNVINKHSKENGSNTPDFILAEYLIDCLRTFDKIIKLRTEWYGEKLIEEKILEVHSCMKYGLKTMLFTEPDFNVSGIDLTGSIKPSIDPEIVKNTITDTSKFGNDDFMNVVNQRFPNEKSNNPSKHNTKLS